MTTPRFKKSNVSMILFTSSAFLFISLTMVCTIISCGPRPASKSITAGSSTGAISSPIEKTTPASSISILEADLSFLAADELQGRGLSSPGLQAAMNYVAERFVAIGLQPAFPNQTSSKAGADKYAGYFQEFGIHGHSDLANVIGILPGDETLSPGVVIVGAHLDHLGTDPNLSGDQIYNGAEDNASGIAALLESARLLTEGRASSSGQSSPVLRDNPSADPLARRTVIFIAFSAEEVGLLGSKYYTEHPVAPSTETLAMINLDSIGRLRDRELYIFGTGSAQEMPSIVEGVNQSCGFNLITHDSGIGASDQNSFLAAGIPAIHIFTGPHGDYHKVSDETSQINFAGLADVTNFTSELLRYLSYRFRPLTYVPGSATKLEKVAEMNSKPKRRVSAGFMPDFSMESGGVKIGPVFPGGPAAEAGMQTGDIIIALNNEPVDSLVDYSTILRDHAPGDQLELTIKRGVDEIQVKVTLQERK